MFSPFLLHSDIHDQEEPQQTTNIHLFNLKTETLHKSIHLPQKSNDLQFLGSSHGWLIAMDKRTEYPFLLDPFSNTLITLPIQNTPSMIIKAILTSNPSSAKDKSYCVVLIYKHAYNTTKLAFCRHGDEKWSYLEGEAKWYHDIFCTDTDNNILLALAAGPLVEAWDLDNVPHPIKKPLVQDSCPKSLAEYNYTIYTRDLYTSRWYLTLWMGHISLVVRYIGEFVREDGEVVYEGDALTDYQAEPLVFPYKTVDFKVYRLDLDNKIWIEVECLEDYAIFVGGSRSEVVSTKTVPQGLVERNAIYFTDDYWDRMDEDPSYGGHDIGVYKLDEGVVETIECDAQRIVPSPIWIIN